ncbi:transcription factor domain-containing protein [Aspergillus stella-maris]|uniref:transcription factor domain-containing protein n=1 Tax=Aspergillus stella-maris TaxID=1810926 RepID=UPI003CCCF1B6
MGENNPRRNAFANGSPADHHARLITVFHIRMAQLLLSVVNCSQHQHQQQQQQPDDAWLMGSWQRVLETCQGIAGLASEWNSAFCIAVDPAITFTTFTTLIFFDLQRKSLMPMVDSRSSALRERIDHDITVLHLQLRHFGRIWTQARLLALSFESFSQSVSGPLLYGHLVLIISRFEAPLHPRWLQFLSSARSVLDACRVQDTG